MFLSRLKLRVQMGDRMLRFTPAGTDTYGYVPQTAEEAAWLRANVFYKRGELWEDGAGAEPEAHAQPSVEPLAGEDAGSVRTVRQAIEWLMEHKGIPFRPMSRSEVVALGAEHGVTFPNLPTSKK